MKRFIFLSCFCTFCTLAVHSEGVVVTMTTSLPVGSSFTITPGRGTYEVDWGDGKPVALVSTGSSVSGTLAGATIIIKGDVLYDLSCSGQQITSLDLSGASMLSRLDCSDNQIASLTLSSLKSLRTLDCSDNQLAALNLSGTQMEELIASNNKIQTLSLAKTLKTLWIDGNQITTLSLANAPILESLICDNNQLSRIRQTTDGNPQLVDFWIPSNQMTDLTLNKSPILETVNVENNQLSHFKIADLANNAKLKQAFLGGNQLLLNGLIPSNNVIKLYAGQQADITLETSVYAVGDIITLPDMSTNEHTGKRSTITYTLFTAEGSRLTRSVDYDYAEGIAKPHILKFLKAQDSPIHLEATSNSYPGAVIKSAPFQVLKDKTGVSATNIQQLKISRRGHFVILSNAEPTPVTIHDGSGRLCWKGIVHGQSRIPLRRGIYVINGYTLAF